MDQYAGYVWSSYGVAFVIIVATVLVSVSSLKKAQKKLSELKNNKD